MRTVAAALAVFACSPIPDPCFTPGYEVSGLQILGVRTDPVTPASSAVIRVVPLIADDALLAASTEYTLTAPSSR